MPIFLTVLILTVWLGYTLKKNSKSSEQDKNKYWQREMEANYARPKDISNLDYIDVPLSDLPFSDAASDAVLEIQNTIRELSEKKLLNLSGLSNTDIKYEYGARNFDILSACDQNYSLLLRYLNEWAYLVYEEGRAEAAKTILEYAVSLKTDVSGSYSLLANIYAAEGSIDKIEQLIEIAQGLTTLMKDSILTNLQSLIQ